MRPRRLIVVPYACARVSVGLLDTAVVGRLPPDSALRTGFDCALGAFDVWAGRLLRDHGIAQDGSRRITGVLHGSVRELGTPQGRTRRPATASAKGYATTRAWASP